MRTSRELKRFLMITGSVLIVVGLAHLILGSDLHDITGEGIPATDSDLRFAGGIYLGLGAIWIYASRSVTPSLMLVRLLASGLLLGGLARLLSILVTDLPGTVTVVQTVIEILAPLAVLWLASRATADPAGTTTQEGSSERTR